ncbi:MAG: hypothetical protein DWQ07_14665 [Chloroflexi bacterium]|nr:MAG: hypothetical protein DWQ07_14665 [Chloroflexota bacterium]MBL1195674.1 hypothetical protein [Chloroflexota bacterium]NOH12962.1 hypothetical protein [Chloroflexota bacterium]
MGIRFVGIIGLFLSLLFLGACGQVEIQEAVTAQPSDRPETTETVEALPTDAATSTPILIVTITPTPVISDVRLTHDLLWLRSGDEDEIEDYYGEIWRWRANTLSAEKLVGSSDDSLVVVPGPILDFDEQNGVILVSLIAGIDAQEEATYQLGIVDIEKLNYRVLVESKQNLRFPRSPFEEIALSPDANWAAYSFGLITDYDLTSQYPFYSYRDREINIFQIDQPWDVISLGRCDFLTNRGSCFVGLHWAPDSSKLAWHGNGGLWIHEIEGSPELFIEDFIDLENETKNIRYSPREWSLDGKYLIYSREGWEWGEKGILEVETGKFVEIPQTRIAVGHPHTEVVLSSPERVYVVQSVFQDPRAEEPPKHTDVTIYEIYSSTDGISLVEYAHRELKSNLQDYAYDPVILPDGDILWIIERIQAEDDSYLPNQRFLVANYELFRNEIIELNQFDFSMDKLEHVYRRFYWISGGSGILIHHHGYAVYVATDGSVSASITEIVGNDACCFAWVEN